MIRSLVRNVALLAAIGMALAASQAQAGFIGSFAVTGHKVTAGGSLTGPIGTATYFGFNHLEATGDGNGGFNPANTDGVSDGDTFSASALIVGQNGSFSFSSLDPGNEGTFTSSGPVVAVYGYSGPNNTGTITSATFNISGSYVGGAVGTTAVPALFVISFTQSGGGGNNISASGTLVIPPPAVPEPASIAMLGLGLGFVGLGVRRSRRKVS